MEISMSKFMDLYKKAGGNEILRQYREGGVLFYAAELSPRLGYDKKSLEILRLAVTNKLLKKVRKESRVYLDSYMKKHPLPCAGTSVGSSADVSTCTSAGMVATSASACSRKVWICWLQGIENAPEVVQKCVASVKAHITDREIVLLTEDNYREYVTFPTHIQERIDDGRITKTHMSDLLRLELLNKYGGTWIDATVYCSGPCPSYMLDSDLFLFQDLKPGADGHPTIISSWFMTACKGNPIIKLTRALLYNYWKNHNSLIDYFLLHDYFQLAIEAYPEVWHRVMPFSNATPHILLLRLFDPCDPVLLEAVKHQTPIHKMTYKFSEESTRAEGTYYQEIFGKASGV